MSAVTRTQQVRIDAGTVELVPDKKNTPAVLGVIRMKLDIMVIVFLAFGMNTHFSNTTCQAKRGLMDRSASDPFRQGLCTRLGSNLVLESHTVMISSFVAWLDFIFAA